jgi:hypothetical protein
MKIITAKIKTVEKLNHFWVSILAAALIFPTIAISQSSPAVVNLGTAGDFVILAKTGISTTGTTQVTGDIGVSPAAASYITGFGLIVDASTTFSTSTLVSGKVYAANYTSPTSAKMTAAISDMQTAYLNAAGRASPNYTELYAGDITGRNLTPGLYKWGTDVLVSSAGVTFSGSATDVWIFQIAQNLTVANGAYVSLTGGALASNVFWQVSGKVTLGTSSAMKGNILCQTGIAMSTSATLNGRALAQTAVTLDANIVTKPSTVTSILNTILPQNFELFQNYPNPFNPSTQIRYNLEKSVQVSLRVYNVLGFEVATLVNGRQEAGSYTVLISINKETLNLASGVYFYRLEAGSFSSTKKLILLK